MTGTLYVPSLNCELNVLMQLQRKLVDATFQYHGPVECLNEPASHLIGVVDLSIDYIFTDPPSFGSNIFYADGPSLGNAGWAITRTKRYEAVWNKHRKPDEGGKTLAEYERLMTEAFREMHRVLKPGRWASVVFHNSDDKVWQAIQRGAEAAGFDLVNAQQMDKMQ